MRLRTAQTLTEVLHNIIHFNGDFGRDGRVAPRLALFRQISPGAVRRFFRQDNHGHLLSRKFSQVRERSAVCNAVSASTAQCSFSGGTVSRSISS